MLSIHIATIVREKQLRRGEFLHKTIVERIKRVNRHITALLFLKEEATVYRYYIKKIIVNQRCLVVLANLAKILKRIGSQASQSVYQKMVPLLTPFDTFPTVCQQERGMNNHVQICTLFSREETEGIMLPL